MSVDYRRDDAEEAGEGWPKARPAPFNLNADYGPFRVDCDERDIEDVSFWASEAGYFDAVSIALAARTNMDDSEITALAYMSPDAARAFAAQLLTAADAVENGEQWDPNTGRSDSKYSEADSQ